MSRSRRRFRSWVRSGATANPRDDAQPAASGRRGRWIAVLGTLAVLLAVAAVGSWLLFLQSGSGEPAGPPRAAIVDQLSLTFPNPEFRQQATATLERAGYVVDYIPGDEVTVDFYRELPEKDYDVLILRAHSARIQGEFRGEPLDEAVIFSNEPYDEESYLPEQIEARLNVAYTHEGAPRVFGITADFVEFSMTDGFDDTMVITMGCEGLSSDRTAEAFINKGADNYISWDNTVSASHTDAATERLLEHMLDGGLSADDAVAQTMAELGPDPAYHSVLRSFSGEG